jgi:drug/metabolite transporter (DMT)-like permease
MALRPALAVFFTILFWGTSFTGIRMALDGFSPGPLAMLRFTIASLVLWSIALVQPVAPPALRDLPRLALLGAIGITTYHLCLNFGQQTVAPGTTALLIQTAPVFTAVFAHLAGIERLRAAILPGIALALAGTAILVVGQGRTVEFTLAALAILTSAVCTAVYFLFQRDLATQLGVRAVTTWTLTFGTLPLWIFAPAAAAQLPQASPTALGALVYIGIFPAALAYLLWNWAVHQLGASRTMMFLYLSPVVAMLSEWWLIGQVPAPLALVGGVVTIAGVGWVNRVRAASKG